MKKLFQDNNNTVQIYDSQGGHFTCPTDEFLTYEPLYTRIPAPYIVRVWTDDAQYINDGSNQTGDTFYTPELFTTFTDTINIYQAAYDTAHANGSVVYPEMYIFFTASGQHVDEAGTVSVSGPVWFNMVDDWDDTTRLANVLDGVSWGLHLFKAAERGTPALQDVFLVTFDANGESSITYTFDKTKFPNSSGLGKWRLYEEDFDLVTLDGVTYYKIRLRVRVNGQDAVRNDPQLGNYFQITVYR